MSQPAQSVKNFKHYLLKRNPNCNLVIIEIIPRHDVSREKITDTISILEGTMPESYTSLRDIRAFGHSENNDVQLNSSMGVYHSARFFKRVIEYVI